ncbi:hypothetical protein Q4595_21095, partial [Wenyingzhuangia sp. 1_MG-2023]|nr:hypothetical protein [Wenyingzhuangia sp. 1_MG-2023]
PSYRGSIPQPEAVPPVGGNPGYIVMCGQWRCSRTIDQPSTAHDMTDNTPMDIQHNVKESV